VLYCPPLVSHFETSGEASRQERAPGLRFDWSPMITAYMPFEQVKYIEDALPKPQKGGAGPGASEGTIRISRSPMAPSTQQAFCKPQISKALCLSKRCCGFQSLKSTRGGRRWGDSNSFEKKGCWSSALHDLKALDDRLLSLRTPASQRFLRPPPLFGLWRGAGGYAVTERTRVKSPKGD
jgi:hypothetical protein